MAEHLLPSKMMALLAWGRSSEGGSIYNGVQNQLKVVLLTSWHEMLLLLKDDGSVVTWGKPAWGQ